MPNGFDALPIPQNKGAPTLPDEIDFDTVERFFQTVERVCKIHGVTSEEEKKKAADMYTPVKFARTWKTLAEFTSPTSTFEDFKKAVLSLYKGTETAPWTIASYNAIIAKYVVTGVRTLAEYMRFYQEAYPAASYLTSRNPPLLAQNDVARTMRQLLPDEVKSAVNQRLQVKYQDRNSGDGWLISQMHEAITFCLNDSDAPYYHYTEPNQGTTPRAKEAPPATAQVKTDVTIKAEDLSTLFQMLLNSQGAAPQQQQPQRLPAPPVPQQGFGGYGNNYGSYGQRPAFPARAPPPAANFVNVPTESQFARGGTRNCYYCGIPGCSLKYCYLVQQDIQAGKVKFDGQSGRVVLASGEEIPRQQPGETLRDVVERVCGTNQPRPNQNPNANANPNRPGVDQMLHIVSTNLNAVSYDDDPSLEAEIEERQRALSVLLAERARKRRAVFDGVELPARPRNPGARDPPPHLPRSGPDSASTTATAGSSRGPPVRKEPGATERAAPPAVPSQSAAAKGRDEPPAPVHPFAKAREVPSHNVPIVRDYQYQNRPFAPRVRPNAEGSDQKGQEKRSSQDVPKQPAYRSVTEVIDPEAEERVFQRSFAQTPSVSMTPIELLSVAPGIRKKLRAVTATRREPTSRPEEASQGAAAVLQATIEEVTEDSDDESDCADHSVSVFQQTSLEASVASKKYLPSEEELLARGSLPKGVYQVKDGTPADETDPQYTVVGDETEPIRSVSAWVNNGGLVECILDGGSEVIGIDAKVAAELDIAYNSAVTRAMRMANGTFSHTLGIAENVPVELGGIVFYVQMHVVRDAPYQILFGRPFEKLLSTRVKNFADGRQELVIHDPNSNQQRTVPTHERGAAPTSRHPRPLSVFHNSRV